MNNIISTIPVVFFYLYNYTPFLISNEIFGSWGSVNIYYFEKISGKVFLYCFDHRKCDGKLMAYSIENNLSGNFKKYSIDRKHEKEKINDYQFITFQQLSGYSKFVLTISTIIRKIILVQNKDISISVVVSKRKNFERKGNYLQFALVKIKKHYNYSEICEVIQCEIKKIQNSKRETTRLRDLYKNMYCVDYSFNSWRDLSEIKTITGERLVRIINHLPKCIIHEIYKSNKKLIFFDYFRDRYLISKVINIKLINTFEDNYLAL